MYLKLESKQETLFVMSSDGKSFSQQGRNFEWGLLKKGKKIIQRYTPALDIKDQQLCIDFL